MRTGAKTRTTTPMAYAERVNLAIDHVAGHLSEPMRLADVARAARLSPFHFHGVFQVLVGETGWRRLPAARDDCAGRPQRGYGTRSSRSRNDAQVRSLPPFERDADLRGSPRILAGRASMEISKDLETASGSRRSFADGRAAARPSRMPPLDPSNSVLTRNLREPARLDLRESASRRTRLDLQHLRLLPTSEPRRYAPLPICKIRADPRLFSIREIRANPRPVWIREIRDIGAGPRRLEPARSAFPIHA